jgi:hypothetical protein
MYTANTLSSGEERLLTLGVAAVGAVRVGVEEFADCEAVGRLGRCELCVDGHRLRPLSR